MPPRKPAPSEIAEATSLVDQQHRQQHQAGIAVEQELDRAMAAAQHLRHGERDRRDQHAADRRPQPLRQRQAAQQPLGPGHGLHGEHAVAGGQRRPAAANIR